jgi:putative oxidoreductase
MKTTTGLDDHSSRRNDDDRSEMDSRPLRWRIETLDRDVRTLLARVGPLLLRVSLGIVFVWFGVLKVAGVSAVGGLVASTVPFLDSTWFVPLLGVLEVLMGLAFATGRFLRVVLPVFALHLGGTFLVIVLLPEVAFEGDNPLMLTVVGEFVVKNLVLLSAGIVAASSVKPLRATGAEA